MIRFHLLLSALLAAASHAATEPLIAFPGAEGYGRFATGGRGGDVFHVTSLDDSGPGTLREGIASIKPGTPRTIVFDVSGNISLKKDLRIENVNGLTIAGQTAPGDGITIRDNTLKILKGSSNIIVRYLRCRLGDESKTSNDSLDVGSEPGVVSHVILDHVTATWGVDGTMDTEVLSNFTMQWCLFGEALNNSTHYKKEPHAMLMSFRKTQGNVSIHHNLLFSSRDRHPTLGGGKPEQSNPKAIFDFRNNLIYNWEGACNLASGRFNLIGNYWRPGPNTDLKRNPYPIAPKAEAHDVTVGFFAGNHFEDQPDSDMRRGDGGDRVHRRRVDRTETALVTRGKVGPGDRRLGERLLVEGHAAGPAAVRGRVTRAARRAVRGHAAVRVGAAAAGSRAGAQRYQRRGKRHDGQLLYTKHPHAGPPGRAPRAAVVWAHVPPAAARPSTW